MRLALVPQLHFELQALIAQGLAVGAGAGGGACAGGGGAVSFHRCQLFQIPAS